MTKKHSILHKMALNYIFAVVRGNDYEDGVQVSKACSRGGIKNLEITYTTPNASDVIKELVRSATDDEVVIGAGTVLDDITAREAILTGAQYIVSPHLDIGIAKVCNRYGIPYLPGCGSVTEIVQALETGVEVVKLFPGGLLGPSYIKDVHGPLPHVEMMPSGGVSIDNIDQWIEKGAWGVGVGSALSQFVKEEGYDSVEREARMFTKKVRSLKKS